MRQPLLTSPHGGPACPTGANGEELSGRKAFDVWRFTEADRAIPWDWADMADREKGEWIDRARTVMGRAA